MEDGVAKAEEQKNDKLLAPGYTVEKLRTMFHDAQNGSADYRKEAEADRDYYDHKQWSDAEIATLNERNQPVITDNRIQRKIDRIIGQEIVGRTDPKAWPRNNPDEKAAEIATDTVRYVFDRARFSSTCVKVAKNMAIEGIGAVDLSVVTVGGRKEIDANYIPWDRLFWDARSSHNLFDDKRYGGTLQWMDVPECAAQFKVEEDELAPSNMTADDETYQDKPANFLWSDSKAKRVLVVYMYYKVSGEWWYCIFTNTVVLKAGKSPYKNDDGTSMCPLKMVSVYVDRDNNRYGVARGLRSLQDAINKMRSKLLHFISVRQLRVDPSSGLDVETIRKEAARPDGVIEARQDELEVLANLPEIQAHFNLLNLTFQEIDEVGPHHSIQGRGVEGQSGRAILAQQQGALAELAYFFDALRDWKLSVASAAWSMAKQFFDGERMIRITDDEDAPRFIQLNKPIGVDQLGQPVLGAIDPRQIDPATGQPKVLMQGALADLDVDIVMDQAPDSAAIQQEQFQMLVDMKKVDPTIPTTAIIAASQLRNKKQILDEMNGANNPEAQQAKQAEMMIAMKDATAKIDKLISETEKNRATAEKTRVETALLPAQAVHDAQMDQQNLAQANEHKLIDTAQRSRSDEMRLQNQQQPAPQGGFSV